MVDILEAPYGLNHPLVDNDASFQISRTCAGPWHLTDAMLYDYNTLVAADGDWHGTWSLVGSAFSSKLSGGTQFSGTVYYSGTYMEGAMGGGGSGTGCWYAIKDPDF